MPLADVTIGADTRGEQPSPLVEGEDFYFDQGRFVLTEEYLRRRGECCDNGCRHCPYRPASTE